MAPFSVLEKILPNVPDWIWEGERFGSLESPPVRRLLNAPVVTLGGELAGDWLLLVTRKVITSAKTTKTGTTCHRLSRIMHAPRLPEFRQIIRHSGHARHVEDLAASTSSPGIRPDAF